MIDDGCPHCACRAHIYTTKCAGCTARWIARLPTRLQRTERTRIDKLENAAEWVANVQREMELDKETTQ